MTTSPPEHPPALRRELGVLGATMMGLGSIVGTGIFVSIAIAVGVAGPSVIVAIVIAGALAVCNALSSAQLAASHPTSGGTYEYGYVFLRPSLGFAAGWMFLCAKTASAAAAALGFAEYLLLLLGVSDFGWRRAVGSMAVILMVTLVLTGLRRSSRANILIVSVTLAALAFFVVAGLPTALRNGLDPFRSFFDAPGDGRHAAVRLLEASALMFVAYTGYGRIATMGEEVRAPRRTIPIAIILTLIVSITLYVTVATVGIGAAGAATFGTLDAATAAPLATIAGGFGVPGAERVLAVGAVTAMLGVLLNLILGLSRVALAMGRRGDLPRAVARVDHRGTTPSIAILLVGAAILALTLLGSIRLAWAFSAFTVLIYYAITNLAALRLPASERIFHPALAWCGLGGSLSLAFWVDARAWIAGLVLLSTGFLLRRCLRSFARTR